MLKSFLKTKGLPLFMKLGIPLILLLVVYFESDQAIKNLDFGLLRTHFHELALYKVFIIILVGIVAVIPMVFYDFILTNIIKMEVPVKKKLIYSWTANTMSNFIGFGGVAGITIRTFFYGQHGYEKKSIIKGIAFISLFYLSGMSLFSWLPLLGVINTPILHTVKWLYIALGGLAAYLPVLIVIIKKRTIRSIPELLKTKHMILLAITSIFEWAFTFITIYMITAFLGVSILDLHRCSLLSLLLHAQVL